MHGSAWLTLIVRENLKRLLINCSLLQFSSQTLNLFHLQLTEQAKQHNLYESSKDELGWQQKEIRLLTGG